MWSGELVQVQQNDRNSDDDDKDDKDDDYHDDDNDDTVAGEAAVFPRQASQHLDWKKSKTTTKLRMDGEISFVKKKLRASKSSLATNPRSAWTSSSCSSACLYSPQGSLAAGSSGLIQTKRFSV